MPDKNTEIPSGFRPADQSGIPVPSRILILELLGERGEPLTFRQLSAAFGIKGKQARNAFEGRLRRMQGHGQLLLDRRQRYSIPDKMDMVPGRVLGHPQGYGFVIPDVGRDDLYLHPRQMRKVLHGDRVLARVARVDSRGRQEGVIVEVLVDREREIVGHYDEEEGVGFVEPDDPRFGRDIVIPAEERGAARPGEIVAVRILHHPIEHRHVVGRITDILGEHMAPGMETEIAIRKHELPHHWPQAVDKHLKKMGSRLEKVRKQRGREDLRALHLVTIDGEDARDFDDAVYCEKIGRNWRLMVAIADVSDYVQPDSALDQEAFERGNSVYFPNRVIPMLPEALSNGICSLRPEEDRNCMVCDMTINPRGSIVDYRFYPALIRSHARLTYNEVAKIVVDRDRGARKQRQAVADDLDNLYKLFKVLLKRRAQRGTIDFEFPEPLILFDDQQRIERVDVRVRNDAHRLIEECMLAANVCAAEFLQENSGLGGIYRAHEGPDQEALTDLRRFLSGFGLQLGGGDAPVAGDYAVIVAAVADKPDLAPLVQSVLLRSLSQAVYTTEETGHFALSYPIYTHFTSPIRRYPDLIVHRLIKHILGVKRGRKLGPDGIPLGRMAEHSSFTERRADDATRDVVQWLKAEFMQDRVGEEFSGVISGVKEFGIFVQLDEVFVDGLVHVTALGNDYFHFDPLHFHLRGERSGARYRLGDRVRVKVVRVDLDSAKIDFELAGVQKRTAGRGRGKPRSKGGAKRGGQSSTNPKNERKKKSKRKRKLQGDRGRK